MKKIGLIAAAGMLAVAGTAMAQTVSLDLRTREITGTGGTTPATYANPGVISVDLTGATEFSIDLYAFVDVTGASAGDVWFGGPLIVSDDGSGSFSKNFWSQFETAGQNPIVLPGVLDNTVDSEQAGLFGAWRSVVNIAPETNNHVSNGELLPDGTWRFLGANTTVGPDAPGGEGKFYTFTWSTTDTSARTVTISLNSENPLGSVIRNADGNVLTPTTAGTITIEIIPAPGAAALLGLGGLVAIRRRR